MDFELSEEQRKLADSVTRFLDQRYSFEQRKAIVNSEAGASDAVWQQLFVKHLSSGLRHAPRRDVPRAGVEQT